MSYISIPVDHLLEPLGHRLHKLLEVVTVVHPKDPELSDLLLQLLKVGGVDILQLLFHPRPHILNWIKIRAVPGPLYQLDVAS